MVVIVMLVDAFLFTLTGFTTDPIVLLVIRMLVGFAAPIALGISYVGEVSAGLPPAKVSFNFALVGVGFNLGTLIGALAGGLLGPEQWQGANFVAGACAALVGLWALVSEAPSASRPQLKVEQPQPPPIPVRGRGLK